MINKSAKTLNLVLKSGLATELVVIEAARPIMSFSWDLQDNEDVEVQRIRLSS